MKMAMNRTHVAEEYFMASMIKKKMGASFQYEQEKRSCEGSLACVST